MLVFASAVIEARNVVICSQVCPLHWVFRVPGFVGKMFGHKFLRRQGNAVHEPIPVGADKIKRKDKTNKTKAQEKTVRCGLVS